jgi:hypothetical protein
MIYINSKNWVYLFLFYGLVGFSLGFLGYLGKESRVLARKGPASSYLSQMNRAGQSEKFAMNWLMGLLKNLRTEKAIPAFTQTACPELIFCFPEIKGTQSLKAFITQKESGFKQIFATVNPIPLSIDQNWEKTIAPIINCDSRYILIGIDADTINSDINKTKIMDSFYFSVPNQYREIYQLCFSRFSQAINSFTIEKQKFNQRDLFRITWEESGDTYLIQLGRMIDILIEVLEQQQVVHGIHGV